MVSLNLLFKIQFKPKKGDLLKYFQTGQVIPDLSDGVKATEAIFYSIIFK